MMLSLSSSFLGICFMFHRANGAGRAYSADAVVLERQWTWHEAETYCEENYQTTLATVVDDADKTALSTAANAAGITGTVWFGLTDLATDTEWEWEDGTPCTKLDGHGTSTIACIDYWPSSEPNAHTNENCGHIRVTDYWVNDLSCDSSRSYYPVCNAPPCAAAHNFVWETLLESGTFISGLTSESHSLLVDPTTLELSIEVVVPYLGKSKAALDDDGYNYGTTYVLDFEDYDAHSDDIAAPGTCQNRVGTDFAGKDWESEVWKYSEFHRYVDSASYLAYAPGGDWSLNGDGCDYIKYSAVFTWDELTSCTNAGNTKNYIGTVDAGDTITLSGTFYVNVVSPYDYKNDYGFYRVYQLLSYPFEIRVSKTVYIVDSVGINLLNMDIIAVYKEDEENVFKLVVLTESAEYLKLTRAGLSGLFSFDPDGSALTKDTFSVGSNAETDGHANAVNDCLENKNYICSQLWVITAPNADCAENANMRDFSGKYGVEFRPECRSTADLGGDADATDLNTHCNTWLTNHKTEIQHSSAATEGDVLLSAPLTWKDEICDPEIFDVQFEAEMTFYVDGYSTLAGEYELYQVGESFVYVEIETIYPSDHIGVFEVELQNVWICTFDPLTPPVMPISDASEEIDGCHSISPQRDDSTNLFTFHIYDKSSTADDKSFEEFEEVDPATLAANLIQFSFKVPGKLARDTLYIHAQIEVILTSGGQTIGRRRRMIGGPAPKGTTQINHFLDRIGVSKGPMDNKPPPPQHYPQQPQQPQPQPYTPPQQKPFVISLQSPWIMAIGGLLALVLTVNVIFMCYVNCIKNDGGVASFGRRRRRYTPVKDADSEFYSERDAINVVSE